MKIGQNITINNRKGIVCFTGNFNHTDYVNICFDDKNEYVTYRVIKDGDDYLFEKETDKNTLSSLLAIWISEELEKNTGE